MCYYSRNVKESNVLFLDMFLVIMIVLVLGKLWLGVNVDFGRVISFLNIRIFKYVEFFLGRVDIRVEVF